MNNQDYYDSLYKAYQDGLQKLKGVQGLPEIVIDNYKAIKGKFEQHDKKRKAENKQDLG